MHIAGMVKTTLLDFPGRLSAVLFASGCRYDCFYCHNRPILQLQDNSDGAAAPIDQGTLCRFLEKRAGLLEGVVVSGGEPALQEDIGEFFGYLKSLGYQTKLDTNGSRPQVIQSLLRDNLVDYTAVDVKAPWRRYQEICGEQADWEAVRESLGILASASVPWEARTTVCPTLSELDLDEIAQQLPPGTHWRWNAYQKPAVFRKKDAWRIHADVPSPGTLCSWAATAARSTSAVIDYQ